MPTSAEPTELPLAAQLFEADLKLMSLEDDVLQTILGILGVQNGQKWPFWDWIRDYYDGSFELVMASRRIVLSGDQRAELKALGFSRCWIRYTEDAADVPADLKRNVIRGEREDFYVF